MSGFFAELSRNSHAVLTALGQHIGISAVAVLLGILAAVPAGVVLSYHAGAAKIVLGLFSVINTIPGIVLLGLAMIFLGIGYIPATVVLFVYSLLPVLRGTYTGITGVSAKVLKAARGVGMSRFQMLRLVQLPLAMPAIITGIRLSAIYIISWATLAAFIGGGGLGDLIWMGLQTYNFNMVLCGAIPATLLSLLVSFLLNRLIRRASRHIGSREATA